MDGVTNLFIFYLFGVLPRYASNRKWIIEPVVSYFLWTNRTPFFSLLFCESVISEGFPSTLDRGDGSVPNLSHKLKYGLGRQRQVPRRYLFWYNLNRICFLFEAPPPTITGARQTELYYNPWMASSPQWWWLENCLICSLINVAEERRWKPITPFNEWDNSQRRGWAISLVNK